MQPRVKMQPRYQDCIQRLKRPLRSWFEILLSSQHNKKDSNRTAIKMEINPGDIVQAEVRKADQKQEAGLKLEERKGKIYIRKVGGLFKRRNVPVQAGDRLHTINGVDVEDYAGGLNEIKALIVREMKIWIKFERMDEDSDEEEEEVDSSDDEEVLLLQGPEYDEDSEEEEEEVLQLTNGGTNKPGVVVTSVEEDDDDDDEDDDNDEDDDIESGMEMRLFKLKKKPKMNGCIVRVIGPADKPGRWQVEILRHPKREVNSGAIMSIATANLKEL